MICDTVYDSVTKIWFGRKKPDKFKTFQGLDLKKSIGEHIFEKMSEKKNENCQIYISGTNEKSTINYGTVLKFAKKIATFIRFQKIGKDKIIGIVAKHSNVVLSILAGCWLNCTTFFPIYSGCEKDYIKTYFGIAKPVMVFCDAIDYPTLSEAFKELQIGPVIYTIDENVPGVRHIEHIFETYMDPHVFEPTKLSDGPGQTSVLLCSSGTTGKPKCMYITNEMLLSETKPQNSKSVLFTFNKLNWITGLLWYIKPLISGCCRIVTNDPPSAELMLDIIQKYKVTDVITTPDIFGRLVKEFSVSPRNIKSLKLLACCGGRVSEPIINEANELFKDIMLFIIYGTSETGKISVRTNSESHKPNSVGKLWCCIEAKIIDSDGKQLGPNKVGELMVKNNRHWHGYLGNDEEASLTQTSDGYIHTGDYCYFDNDGYLYYVDRKKEVLKYKGVDYTPSEIENVIHEIKAVVEVCAFGMHNDYEMDAPAVAVILTEGTDVNEMYIKDYAKRHLPRNLELTGGVWIVKDFPRTSCQKVIRRKVRQHFEDMLKSMKKLSITETD